MAKRRITETTPHDTPKTLHTLVLQMPKISAKFDQGHPLRGRRMQVGWIKIGNCHGRVQTCRPMGACIACLVISVGGVCGRCWS